MAADLLRTRSQIDVAQMLARLVGQSMGGGSSYKCLDPYSIGVSMRHDMRISILFWLVAIVATNGCKKEDGALVTPGSAASQSSASSTQNGSLPSASKAVSHKLPDVESSVTEVVEKECLKHWLVSPGLDLKNADWIKSNAAGRNPPRDLYTATFEEPTGTTKVGNIYYQGRKLRCQITVDPISDADRLNGLEWRGEMWILAMVSREYVTFPGATNPAAFNSWSAWKQMSSAYPLTLIEWKAEKRNGAWKMGPADGPNHEQTGGIAAAPQ